MGHTNFVVCPVLKIIVRLPITKAVEIMDRKRYKCQLQLKKFVSIIWFSTIPGFYLCP